MPESPGRGCEELRAQRRPVYHLSRRRGSRDFGRHQRATRAPRNPLRVKYARVKARRGVVRFRPNGAWRARIIASAQGGPSGNACSLIGVENARAGNRCKSRRRAGSGAATARRSPGDAKKFGGLALEIRAEKRSREMIACWQKPLAQKDGLKKAGLLKLSAIKIIGDRAWFP